MQPHRYLALLLLLLALPACGPGNPLGRRAVSGRITLDGKPLEDGNIRFLPQQPGGISSGSPIANGDYSLEVLKGLPPGKYQVQIFASDKTQTAPAPVGAPGGFFHAKIERIPPKYNIQSTLTVEVTASERPFPATFDFDLNSPTQH